MTTPQPGRHPWVPPMPHWVRWGLVAVSMATAMPRAGTLGWVLIVVTLALSLPALWYPLTGGPRGLLPVVLPAIVATSAAVWVLAPSSWASASMYTMTFMAVFRLPPASAIASVVLNLAGITWWVFARQLDIGDVLSIYAILAVVVLLALNRRNRMEKLEQAELALARAQTANEEHARAAALAERARIARELHDVLAHSLAGLALNLQGARLMLMRDGASPDAVGQIERAQKLATDGLAEARKAVAALREDAVPVERAVSDLLAAYRMDTGARADLAVEGDPRELDAAIGATLVRAVQEALANTRKHAPKADVDVTLNFAAGQVELTVADRQGRRPPEAPAAGYGLRGMGERVALLDGRLDSGPVEDGWRIHLTVPG
ncbi:sensor histidine kinase [Amycolatopsis sp. NPDC059027]|uniref:sensor histidine kinase n=1 Tax=unclassified Amycolatopsis TaxID=2618356 RepID=UPI00367315BD